MVVNIGFTTLPKMKPAGGSETPCCQVRELRFKGHGMLGWQFHWSLFFAVPANVFVFGREKRANAFPQTSVKPPGVLPSFFLNFFLNETRDRQKTGNCPTRCPKSEVATMMQGICLTYAKRNLGLLNKSPSFLIRLVIYHFSIHFPIISPS